jgi:hypothetical protein
VTDVSIMAVTSAIFAVGVFKDAEWAARGVEALERQGFPREAISLIGRETPETAALGDRLAGAAGGRLEIAQLGRCVAIGPLVMTLQDGGDRLARKGLADTLRLAGFQQHDGRIFAALTERGGVLVSVRSEPRAADALATLHSYGGGNAAIGAWHGRV